MNKSGMAFTPRRFLASALGLGSLCAAFSRENQSGNALAAESKHDETEEQAREPAWEQGLPVHPPGDGMAPPIQKAYSSVQQMP